MPKIVWLESEKKAALEILSKDDLEKIQKDYPLKKVRNAKIYEILQRGFSAKVVSVLSGLSYYRVWVIASFGVKTIPDSDLIKIQAAIEVFNHEIKTILNHRSK